MPSLRTIALLSALLTATCAGAAQITDRLLVGLYADSELKGEPMKLLETGTAVDIRTRTGTAILVRLGDGTQGWLDPAYVSEEKPAATRLLELQAELAGLRGGVAPAAPCPPAAAASNSAPAALYLPLLTALGGALLGLAAGVGIVEYRLRRRFPAIDE